MSTLVNLSSGEDPSIYRTSQNSSLDIGRFLDSYLVQRCIQIVAGCLLSVRERKHSRDLDAHSLLELGYYKQHSCRASLMHMKHVQPERLAAIHILRGRR